MLAAASRAGLAQKSDSADKGSGEQAKPGFAIESEMLTYSAMDAEGAQLACGIARHVGAADAGCSARAVSGPAPGVVVVTAGSSAMSEFQLWRTDISTMDMLALRAEHYCAQSRGVASLLDKLVGLIPEGQAIQFAASLLTTTSETAPLEGDILDQTLANDVAGHLRALGVAVVIPDTYMPRSLNSLDQTHSPFLQRYVALMKARECVAPKLHARAEEKELPGVSGAKSGEACPPTAESASEAAAEADKLAISKAIDAFLQSLTLPVAAEKAGAEDADAKPAAGISHLSAVLRADGLAQAVDTGSGANGAWYVLSLKALESGGTYAKSGNAILGMKTTYTGGAVGTYSLFKLDGALQCSGAFYNFTGPVQQSALAKLLTSPEQVAAGKLVGGCGTGQ